MPKFLVSAATYFTAYVVLGMVNISFDILIADRFDHEIGLTFAFQLITAAVLVSGAGCAILFVAFSALLGARSSISTSLLLGALTWSLLEGIGIAFGPFKSSHASGFLLFVGVPLVAAIISRAMQANYSLKRTAANRLGVD